MNYRRLLKRRSQQIRLRSGRAVEGGQDDGGKWHGQDAGFVRGSARLFDSGWGRAGGSGAGPGRFTTRLSGDGISDCPLGPVTVAEPIGDSTSIAAIADVSLQEGGRADPGAASFGGRRA
jgi:hypothetical protein